MIENNEISQEEIEKINYQETYTKQKENLSELIKELFISQNIFKVKIKNLKSVEGKDAVPLLLSVRRLGEYITVLSQTIIYTIYNNYNLCEENKDFFSKIKEDIEEIPCALHSGNYAWNPEKTEKIIESINIFLQYLQEKDYIKREDSINLKELVEIEIDNLKKELEQRNIIAKEISKDIFIEYFSDTIKEIKNKIKFVDLNKIKKELEDIPLETKEKTLKTLEIIEEENINYIEQSIINIYNEKIRVLPEVNILYTIIPSSFSKALIQEQNAISNKILELLNPDSYNIKTLHILFTISNLLNSYSEDKSLIQKKEVCEELLSAAGKKEEKEKLYKVVMLYLREIQSTLRRSAGFVTIKC